MLFHSQLFLVVFLPAVLGAYYLLADRRGARSWLLIVASLVFYGYWDARLVPLLVATVLVNWAFARLAGARPRRWLLPAGVALDLAVLGFFKYADFFAGTLAAIGGWRHDPWSIVLPLGISFFTFQQISYLVDLHRGRAPVYGLRDYALYVTFFPQLIAGPIVRHNEIIDQFALDPRREGLHERLSRGFLLLLIGLVKKTLIANELGLLVDPLFADAAAGASLTFAESWIAAVAFALQIYFDFSAYSDMAIGLALMFGFSLPFNFAAPFKATSIRELWRRWHMTLTRFLTDYVYVPVGMALPLGARRNGWLREGIATMVTMLLCGLWHGAAWTFVVWGGAHGAAMSVNQAWRRRRLPMPAWLGWALTFLFFAYTIVLFRAPDFSVASDMMAAMVGAGPAGGGAFDVRDVHDPGVRALVAGGLAAFLAPTSQHLSLELARPWRIGAAAAALGFVYLILLVGGPVEAEFIYFQF